MGGVYVGGAARNVAKDLEASAPANTPSSGLSATFSPFHGEKGLRDTNDIDPVACKTGIPAGGAAGQQ